MHVHDHTNQGTYAQTLTHNLDQSLSYLRPQSIPEKARSWPRLLLALASSESKTDLTYVPPHGPSGQPAMRYLRLLWSHGPADLVCGGFLAGMTFVDQALERGDGVLIRCQCGVSRSATLVITLVMCATHSDAPSMLPEVLALKNSGMHASYPFVEEKSKWYEHTLCGGNQSSMPSDQSSQLAEEAECGR